MAPGLNKDEAKEALKEAIKEKIDEAVNAFGWWSLRLFATALASALVYFIISFHGFGNIKLH